MLFSMIDNTGTNCYTANKERLLLVGRAASKLDKSFVESAAP